MCSHVSERDVCFPAGAVFMCSLSPASARAPAIKVITWFSLSAGRDASKRGKNSHFLGFLQEDSSFLGSCIDFTINKEDLRAADQYWEN